MTRKTLILLGAGLSLMAVLAIADPGMVVEGIKVSPAALRGEISQYLRDPDSARFDGLHVVSKPEGYKYLCGYVNGRNGFGGYTGFQPFLATLDSLGHVRSVTFVSQFSTEGDILSECRTN